MAICACLGGLVLAVNAQGALVTVPPITVRANGGFSPHLLPRHRYAPIELRGRADITSSEGIPSPLRRMVLEFDRDGRLSTRGLPVCQPGKIRNAGVATARRRCHKAIVGTGEVHALVVLNGFWVKVRAPLTLFNAPRNGALARVLAHAQPTSLFGETYLVSVPIQRARGRFRYRATVNVPRIFDGSGVLVHAHGKIRRLFRARGAQRSYVAARCRGDGLLAVHGSFRFEDGTVISGEVEQPCTPKRR